MLSTLSLSLTLSHASVFENARSNLPTGTVTRSGGDHSQELTVLLTSSDTTELRVPDSVFIPAGQTSQTFTLTPVDDDLLDGTQTVTITATAANHTSTTGAFDASFGTGGAVETGEHIAAIVPLGDGRLYTVGYLAVDTVNISTGNLYDLVVRRIHADGSPDTSFGTLGRVQADVTGRKEIPNAAALQPDGKLLVAGLSGNGPLNHQMLVRFNPDGSLDGTFGQEGKIIRAFENGSASFEGVAVLPGGAILAGGTIGGTFNLVRFQANGVLDTRFGVGGTAEVAANVAGSAQGMVVDGVGRAVLVGTHRGGNNDSLVTLVRYTSAGFLDSTFGQGGVVFTDLPGRYDEGRAVALLPDSTLVVAASSSEGNEFPPQRDFYVLRYSPNGQLHPNFGTGGMAFTDLGDNERPNAIAVEADGTIALAGYSRPRDVGGASSDRAALARYTPTGQLIESVVTELPAGRAIEAVVVQDGWLYLGGKGLTTFSGRISRFGPGGLVGQSVTASATIDVLDFETITLSVPESSRVLTLGEAATVSVRRSNTDVHEPVTVWVRSESPTELIAPATVVIPAGQQETTFEVSAVDNGIPDGTRPVRLSVGANGYAGGGSDSVTVVEPGTTSLAVLADGTATDTNGDGVFSQVDTTAQTVRVRDRERGVFEFDLASIDTANASVSAVALTLRPVIAQYSSYGTSVVSVYAYSGDGVVTPTDAMRTGLNVGEFTIVTASDGGTTLDRQTVVLDTAAIRGLMAEGRYVGFVAVMTATVPGGLSLDVYASEATFTDPSFRPQLHFILTPSRPPVFDPASYAFSVADAAAVGAEVGRVFAKDPDPGDTLTYAIVGGNEDGRFAVDRLTGVISVAAGLVDDASRTFSLTVQATDSGLRSAEAAVSITVDRTLNRAPTIDAIAPQPAWAGSGAGTVVARVEASDPDGDALSYSLIAGNEAGLFAIDPTTGVLVVAPGRTLPEGTYTLTVQVTDNWASPQSTTATVTLDIGRRPIEIGIAPEAITLQRTKTVEVTILATATLDPTRIDLGTLRLGVSGTEASVATDKRGRPLARYVDVNGDGRLDLLVTFNVPDLGLTDAHAGLEVALTLRGMFGDGILFHGLAIVSVTSSSKGGGNGKGNGGNNGNGKGPK